MRHCRIGQTVDAAVSYYGQETFDEMALNYKVISSWLIMLQCCTDGCWETAAPERLRQERAETTANETRRKTTANR